MVRQKKKGQSGEAKRYITRSAALKKLQLSLPSFRRLCILKGIYPREPKNRLKAQRGISKPMTLYLLKDIQFLMHEPIIWKFREHRAVMKKVKKAYNRKEEEKGASLFGKRPRYKLNHIVRERYPTFTDALNDLDDPLTLAFLYTRMPIRKGVKPGVIDTAVRLTSEFLLYVIEAKALRKVFISIKGYYYQVEIMGQTVTWISPHKFAATGRNVDHRIMKTFLEFYLVLIGFVNYRLYTSLDLYYPPQLPGSLAEVKKILKQDAEHLGGTRHELQNQVLSSLNVKIMRIKNESQDQDEDKIDMHLLQGMDVKEAEKESEMRSKQQNLFKDMKFFLGRETNLESLTFVIRSCSGKVSWDKLVSPGSTYSEDDETITHQIADRPQVKRQYMSRYYVQPQWVYDCINARMLLPIQDYFPGAELPPHLSPFDQKDEIYIPPEQKRLLARQRGEVPEDELQKPEDSDDEAMKDDIKVELPIPKSYYEIKRERRKKWKARVRRRRMEEEARAKEMAELDSKPSSDAVEGTTAEGAEEGATAAEGNSQETAMETDEQDKDNNDEEVREIPLKEERKEPAVMEVTKGKKLSHQGRVRLAARKAELRLSIMMLSRKRRKVYWAIKRKEVIQQRKADRLKAKREVIDKQREVEKREQRKKLLKGHKNY